MKVQIVGIQKGQSRNGRGFTNLHFTTEYTPYESQNGSCVGFKVGTEFTYADLQGIQPGDVVDLVYEKGYQDKATLANVVMLEKKKG